MRLIEQFKYVLYEDEYSEGKEVENSCEDIANSFAIKFAMWLAIHCDYKELLIWQYKGKDYACVELLKVFKNDVNFGYNVQ